MTFKLAKPSQQILAAYALVQQRSYACCDVHRLFSLETGARARTRRLLKSTRGIVGLSVGAAENSPYLPNSMPSTDPLKHDHRSFLVSTESPNVTTHTLAISSMDVYSNFYRF